jgi:hypothetical protein
MTMFGSQWFANPGVTYEIDNSCRFNDDDVPVLTRTNVASVTDAKIWTFSCWFKRGNLTLSVYRVLLGGYDDASGAQGIFAFDAAADTFEWQIMNAAASGYDSDLLTNAVYRDPTAWYHLVVLLDTTQGTPADRNRVYINGVAQTFTGTSFSSENFASDRTNLASKAQYLASWVNTSYGLDGYMAEAHFLDGTVAEATAFGETNSDGVWVPKKYTGGSYGNNGFYLDFASSGDLGNDVSGNNNDFTSTNLAAADQMLDTPTNNFATLNPLIAVRLSTPTLSEGNLEVTAGGAWSSTLSTISVPRASGKWYAEMYVLSGSQPNGINFGVTDDSNSSLAGATAHSANVGVITYSTDGSVWTNAGNTASWGATYTNGDIIGLALNLDDDEVSFYKNNSLQASALSLPANITEEVMIITDQYARATVFNFGQDSSFAGNATAQNNSDDNGIGDFFYAPPSGFLTICTSNLSTPAVKDSSEYFQIELYTGNGTAIGSGGKAVTFTGNSSMQPDFVWIKNRDTTDSHSLYDAVRGTTKQIESDTNTAETTETEGLTTFGSDGFTVGSLAQVNTNTEDYVSWNWKESATPGLDIVGYTGDGANRTISHNLGVVPKMIIVKNRSAADSWKVYHANVATDPQTDYLVLDTSAASVDDATVWNDTAPTSSVFSIGTNTNVNTDTETYVAYVFTSVEGFSQFGGYTGNNNANGSFIWCGFKPRFLIVKKIASGNWMLSDTARNPYNPAATLLFPSTTDADTTGTDYIDFVSNGFKLRHTGGLNAAVDYIFMAFAENPFGGSGVAPATAR